MIAKITGTIDEINPTSVIVDVHGIGYQLFVPPSVLTHIHEGKSYTFYTHHVIRETNNDLYGFLTKKELSFFELLLTVSGIGPKSALGALTNASIETITEGIQSGYASHLTKIAGIGKKSAEKIVVELKDKVGVLNYTTNTSGAGDAIEALTALGYSLAEAREAIKHVDKDASTEDMVKQALKTLL